MNRVLPVIKIAGDDFIVDVAHLQLYEKENPKNVISLSDMRDVGDGYVFDYSPIWRNLAGLNTDDDSDCLIKIDELVKLDPVGMAEKYGFSLEGIKGKTDFQVMVNQQALHARLQGNLPTVEIAGQLFDVDITMDKLRAKDDFLAKGIEFNQIDHYYIEEQQVYIIPFNTSTRSFQGLEYETITAIPNSVVMISFPHESILDPVGFNTRGGWEETDGLKINNIHSHFKAAILDWKETGIEETIKENLKKLQKQKPQSKINQHNRKQKGPKM